MAGSNTGIDINVMPIGIGFMHWSATVVSDNPSLPQPTGEDSWREWADHVTEVDPDVPSHLDFDGWREWAQRWFGIT